MYDSPSHREDAGSRTLPLLLSTGVAIEDPNETDTQTFDRVYGEIAESVENLVDVYTDRNRKTGR